MKPEEIAVLKETLEYIKIARHSDHITYNMMLGNDTFGKILKSLEGIAGWNTEDERRVEALAKKFAEETKGHTLKEKSEKIGKILAVGGIATAIALASGIALVIHDNQKRKKKSNAEK